MSVRLFETYETGRLGKGTALLVAKPLSLREALQTLEICAKANVAVLPQGDSARNQFLGIFFCLWCQKNTGEKTNHQESRIKNSNNVVWDILEMMDLGLGYCVPEWKTS